MTEPTEHVEETGSQDVPAQTEGAAPDAGNTENIDQLTDDLDEDDDVYERVALVNTCEPDQVEQAPDDAK